MKLGYVVLAVGATLALLGCVSQESRSNRTGNKVLLIPREEVLANDIMWAPDDGTLVITRMLEEEGFDVVVATVSGGSFRCWTTTGSTSLEADLSLADVNTADYVAFIVLSGSDNQPIPPEVVAIVQQAEAEGKPVAAQRWGVLVLAEAGVLKGKKYSFPADPVNKPYGTLFVDATYAGYAGYDGVQDGNIITTSTCPKIYDSGEAFICEMLIAELRK